MPNLDKVERRKRLLIKKNKNMEQEESVPVLSRKELRKQKLMEYLAAKAKIKPTNPTPNLHEDSQVKRPVMSAVKLATGKENQAPAERFRGNGPKSQTLNVPSKQDPDRRTFGITNKANVKGSVLKGQQKAAHLSSSSGTLQTKPNRNHVLTRTYSVVSSKSNLNTATHLKKQPHTRIQTSGKAPFNAAATAGAKSNSKFRLNAASSGPVKTVNMRLSLGPLVKTRTGLIPAVTQPRTSKSDLTHTSATTANSTSTLVAKKMRSSTTSSVSLSQRSTMGVPSTARAGNKLQAQTKYNSKPVLGKHSQPSCKNQLSRGLKSASTSFKSTAAPFKPEGRVAATRSAAQSADGSSKLKSGVVGQKNAAFQTSSKLMNRCNSRAVGGVTGAVGSKTKTRNEADCKKKNCSENASLPRTSTKPSGAQTAPQPARTISLTGHNKNTKTPKVLVRILPQTEGKKLTAAQEDRLRKLQEWREAKGISYKRPPMPVKAVVRRTVSVPQPFWASMKEEDEAHSLIYAVDRSLADCIKLLEEGCAADQVEEVLSRLPPMSQKFAKYWICRVRLMEHEGNLDVLPVFEEAVRVVLEPVDELRTVVFEILKKKDEIQASKENEKEDISSESSPDPLATPKPVRALICGEKGDSSVVKYKITATPGGPPSQQREPVRVNGQEVRFFTPVRRSVRIERASIRYPSSLQDHDLCVNSYNELISEEDKNEQQSGGDSSPSVSDTPMYVYRENEALRDKVLIQLFSDDGV